TWIASAGQPRHGRRHWRNALYRDGGHARPDVSLLSRPGCTVFGGGCPIVMSRAMADVLLSAGEYSFSPAEYSFWIVVETDSCGGNGFSDRLHALHCDERRFLHPGKHGPRYVLGGERLRAGGCWDHRRHDVSSARGFAHIMVGPPIGTRAHLPASAR